MISILLFQTHIDADIFHHWIVQGLLPKIPVGSLIVMDNASFHKRDDIRLSIEKAGCFLGFLPPYAPDLNPIEHLRARFKSIRLKHRSPIHDVFSFFERQIISN